MSTFVINTLSETTYLSTSPEEISSDRLWLVDDDEIHRTVLPSYDLLNFKIRNLSIEYTGKATHLINLLSAGNILGTIDASDFIIDGVIEDAEFKECQLILSVNTKHGQKVISSDVIIDDQLCATSTRPVSNSCLYLNFNEISDRLDSIEDDYLKSEDLLDYYTKSELDLTHRKFISSVVGDSVVDANINNMKLILNVNDNSISTSLIADDLCSYIEQQRTSAELSAAEWIVSLSTELKDDILIESQNRETSIKSLSNEFKTDIAAEKSARSTAITSLSSELKGDVATEKQERITAIEALTTELKTDIQNKGLELSTYTNTKAAAAVVESKAYTDDLISRLSIDNYETKQDALLKLSESKTYTDDSISNLSIDNYETKIDSQQKLTAAKAYTDASIADLSISTTYETKSDASSKLSESKSYTDESITDLSIYNYETKIDAESKLDESKSYTDEAIATATSQLSISVTNTEKDLYVTYTISQGNRTYDIDISSIPNISGSNSETISVYTDGHFISADLVLSSINYCHFSNILKTQLSDDVSEAVSQKGVEISSYVNSVSSDLSSSLSISISSTTDAGEYLKKYTFYQNGIALPTTIDIPKDFFVTSAVVSTCIKDGEPSPCDPPLLSGDKFIDFTINTKEGGVGQHLYVNVSKLVDIYRGDDTDTISLSISPTNVITAAVKHGSLTKQHLSTDVFEFVESTVEDKGIILSDYVDLTIITATSAMSAYSEQYTNSVSSMFKTKYVDDKVEKVRIGDNGIGYIFNEGDGGGSKYVSNLNITSYVGVNDPTTFNGLAGQLYVISGESRDTLRKTKLNMYDGMFCYVKGENPSTIDEKISCEIATISDISSYVEALSIDSKFETKEHANIKYSDLCAYVDNSISALSVDEKICEVTTNLKTYVNDKLYISSDVGIAEIKNENEGGGSFFTTSDKKIISYVGVNNPKNTTPSISGIAGQLYVVNSLNKDNIKLTKLNMYDGMFCYVKGENPTTEEERLSCELATISAVNASLDIAITALSDTYETIINASAKYSELSTYSNSTSSTAYQQSKKYTDDKQSMEISSEIGIAKIKNEDNGGGALFYTPNKITSYVGVNNPNTDTSISGIAGQLYVAKYDNGTLSATKINMYLDKFCYVKGPNPTEEARSSCEIAVLSDVIHSATTSYSQLSISLSSSPSTGNYIKRYQLILNNNVIGDIDIPHDFLVKSAALCTCISDDVPPGCKIGDKYIDFVINAKDTSGTEAEPTHIILKVSDLADIYTGKSTDTITVSVDNYEISSWINDKSITMSKMSTDVYDTLSNLSNDAIDTAADYTDSQVSVYEISSYLSSHIYTKGDVCTLSTKLYSCSAVSSTGIFDITDWKIIDGNIVSKSDIFAALHPYLSSEPTTVLLKDLHGMLSALYELSKS